MPRKLRKPAVRPAKLDLDQTLYEIFSRKTAVQQRYHSPPGSPVDCPALADANAALHASRDLLQALRRLRGDLNLCSICPLDQGCETLQALNGRISQAIEEITETYVEPHAKTSLST